jgi:hypothetical protein
MAVSCSTCELSLRTNDLTWASDSDEAVAVWWRLLLGDLLWRFPSREAWMPVAGPNGRGELSDDFRGGRFIDGEDSGPPIDDTRGARATERFMK